MIETLNFTSRTKRVARISANYARMRDPIVSCDFPGPLPVYDRQQIDAPAQYLIGKNCPRNSPSSLINNQNQSNGERHFAAIRAHAREVVSQ